LASLRKLRSFQPAGLRQQGVSSVDMATAKKAAAPAAPKAAAPAAKAKRPMPPQLAANAARVKAGKPPIGKKKS
jgi:hypothetical protein